MTLGSTKVLSLLLDGKDEGEGGTHQVVYKATISLGRLPTHRSGQSRPTSQS